MSDTIKRVKFKLFDGSDGDTYVRISSNNNETWFVSEGYINESGAMKSVNAFASLWAEVFGLDPKSAVDEAYKAGRLIAVKEVELQRRG